MLSISKKEFDLLFPEHAYLWELLTTQPRTEQELFTKYMPSKLWRLNNLYQIIDKQGLPRTFKMNRAQFHTYAKLFTHPRLIILKSRQQGISTLFLVSFCDDALFLPNFNCGLMAQDKDAAETLLERVTFLWDNMIPEVNSFLSRKLIKNNTQELKFNNNSTLFIRTSFRSTTLHRLHVSELGKIANKFPQKAKEVFTGTLQALAPGNIGVIESTAEGDNKYKTTWDQAYNYKVSALPPSDDNLTEFQRLWDPELEQHYEVDLAPKDFYPVFLPWLYDPDCVSPRKEHIIPDHQDYFDLLEKNTGIELTEQQKKLLDIPRARA